MLRWLRRLSYQALSDLRRRVENSPKLKELALSVLSILHSFARFGVLRASDFVQDPDNPLAFRITLRPNMKISRLSFKEKWGRAHFEVNFKQRGKTLECWLSFDTLAKLELATMRYTLTAQSSVAGSRFFPKFSLKVGVPSKLSALTYSKYLRPFSVNSDYAIKGRFYFAPDSTVSFLTAEPLLSDVSERGVVAECVIADIKNNSKVLCFGIEINLLLPAEVDEVKSISLIRTDNERGVCIPGRFTLNRRSEARIVGNVVFDKSVLSKEIIPGRYRLSALCVTDESEYWVAFDQLSETSYLWLTKLIRPVIACGELVLAPQVINNMEFIFHALQRSRLDSLWIRFKEASAIWLHENKFPSSIKPVLLYEKYATNAQDNSFALFEWVMKNDLNSDTYYIMDPLSPQASIVAPYAKHVLKLYSFKYFRYLLAARMLVSSDIPRHTYGVDRRFGRVPFYVSTKTAFFLQHGVTGLKRLSYALRAGTSSLDYFLAATTDEQKILIKSGGYTAGQAPLLGFPRWDRLAVESDPHQNGSRSRVKSVEFGERDVLFFPTWRQWLKDATSQQFLESDYYQGVQNLLNSPAIAHVLNDHDLQLKVFLHPNMQKFSAHLIAESDSRVQILEAGEIPVSQLTKNCCMVISDYSSIVWDFAYQRKPVSFYQFDQNKYQHKVGSYLDLNNIPIGSTWKSAAQVATDIENYAEADFHLDASKQAIIDEIFPFGGSISETVWGFIKKIDTSKDPRPYLSYQRLREAAQERTAQKRERFQRDFDLLK